MTDTFAKGWDYESTSQGGKAGFVSIPHKGDSAKFRIVAPPEHFKKETNFNNERKIATRHLCLVIERQKDGDEVKVLELGDQVFFEIKKYLMDPDWGDVTKYDFTIKRNKEKTTDAGSEPFYSVSPSPKKSDITPEELQMITDAGIDLARLAENLSVDKKSKTSQSFPTSAPETEAVNEGDLPF